MSRTRVPASVVSAGFVTVLVGFTSSAAIVFQAARAGGASPAEVSSWIGALGIGMGVTCIGLSLRYRAPIVTAWSTPGAALLVTSLVGVPLADAIGAFMFSAVLIVAAGVSGLFERLITRVPLPLAQALLAGVLVRFGLAVFTALRPEFGLVCSMLVAYVACRRVSPRYTMVVVLGVGIAVAGAAGLLRVGALHVAVTTPRFVAPAFSLKAMISVGVPLFLVTMASQNVPGVAVLRASGYTTPISPLITATGLATLVLAPFGAFAINLAAITAAICTGPEAHEDPARRYMASVTAGGLYLVVGVFGATVAALFAAFPPALVAVVAGLALLPTIGASLAGALASWTRGRRRRGLSAVGVARVDSVQVSETRSAEPDGLPEPPAKAVRRATMRGSRLAGLVGAGVGAAAGAGFGWSPWISAVVGFIILAETPDVIYRLRSRRGDTSPLLPAWDASEAYLVTVRRWRRSRVDPPG